jgi:sensor histidine kinase YesM
MAKAHTLEMPTQEPGRKFKISIRFRHFKNGIVQVAFWALSYFILLAMFADSSEWRPIDHLYTLVFMSTLMMCVIVNSWILIPRFLPKSRYKTYVAAMLLDIIVFTGFNFILFDKLIDYILPGYYFISYYELIDLLKFFAAFIAITTLIQLAMEWFQLQETREAIMLLEKEKVAAELQALTNQVNPHFLFNSLSVLYSLALRESKETPNAIMQLSDILRYVIYDSTKKMVTLESEVTLIKNYIALQQFRIHPTTKVNFEMAIKEQNALLMPMIFLPLIENSFKHGVHSETENAFIHISLKSLNARIEFSIVNSKAIGVSRSPEGIGLKNIESRLRLVYHEDHTFRISEKEHTFQVDLNVPAFQ